MTLIQLKICGLSAKPDSEIVTAPQRKKMIYAVIQVWYRDPEVQEMCKKLVDSMEERVKLVLKARGGTLNTDFANSVA
jgi:hypothetical protein